MDDDDSVSPRAWPNAPPPAPWGDEPAGGGASATTVVVVVITLAVAIMLYFTRSVELAIVAALCLVLAWVAARSFRDTAPPPPPPPPSQAGAKTVRFDDEVAKGDSSARRRRRRKAELTWDGGDVSTRRLVIHEPLLRTAAVPAELTELPSEGVLDDALRRERERRGNPDHSEHATRRYYTEALPNAIRAAARELTTNDPAIVPLDADELVCTRALGEV